MKDLQIHLENKPGALADVGEILAGSGLSIEGGGAWTLEGNSIAHFLFEDTSLARKALEAAGVKVTRESDVLIQKLKQDVPGQLGKITRLMAKSGINIEVIYSDHYNQLIMVVDDYEKGKLVSDKWTKDNVD